MKRMSSCTLMLESCCISDRFNSQIVGANSAIITFGNRISIILPRYQTLQRKQTFSCHLTQTGFQHLAGFLVYTSFWCFLYCNTIHFAAQLFGIQIRFLFLYYGQARKSVFRGHNCLNKTRSRPENLETAQLAESSGGVFSPATAFSIICVTLTFEPQQDVI